jgi:hypothetical protein
MMMRRGQQILVDKFRTEVKLISMSKHVSFPVSNFQHCTCVVWKVRPSCLPCPCVLPAPSTALSLRCLLSCSFTRDEKGLPVRWSHPPLRRSRATFSLQRSTMVSRPEIVLNIESLLLLDRYCLVCQRYSALSQLHAL